MSAHHSTEEEHEATHLDQADESLSDYDSESDYRDSDSEEEQVEPPTSCQELIPLMARTIQKKNARIKQLELSVRVMKRTLDIQKGEVDALKQGLKQLKEGIVPRTNKLDGTVSDVTKRLSHLLSAMPPSQQMQAQQKELDDLTKAVLAKYTPELNISLSQSKAKKIADLDERLIHLAEECVSLSRIQANYNLEAGEYSPLAPRTGIAAEDLRGLSVKCKKGMIKEYKSQIESKYNSDRGLITRFYLDQALRKKETFEEKKTLLLDISATADQFKQGSLLRRGSLRSTIRRSRSKLSLSSAIPE